MSDKVGWLVERRWRAVRKDGQFYAVCTVTHPMGYATTWEVQVVDAVSGDIVYTGSGECDSVGVAKRESVECALRAVENAKEAA